MRSINNIISKIAFCALAASLSPACMLEKESPWGAEQGVMIEMKVSAGAMTKADPTASEETIKSIHVYAFSGERLAGYLDRQNASENESFYMDLRLPESGKHAVDFILVANAGQMVNEGNEVAFSEKMTKSQLRAIKYSGIKSSDCLPMYADTTVTIDVDAVSSASSTLAGHDGHHFLTQKVDFRLYRSLAKISMYAAKVSGSASVPRIISATYMSGSLRRHSYLFPQEDAVLSSLTSYQNEHRVLSAPVVVTKSVEKGSDAAKLPSNYTPILMDSYLPEAMDNVVIYVEYALSEGGELKPGYVYMPRIERNTHYKICILINAEGQLILNYYVEDWETNTIDGITFDYPTHSYLRDKIPASDEDVLAKPEVPARMSESKPFSGYFQMTYPENDAWMPTLKGAHAGNCDIEVYEIDGVSERKVTSRPIPASEYWYRIDVIPNPVKVDVGVEVDLVISYQASGFDTMEYILINGTYQEYYWPYDGTASQDANCVTITMVN